MRTRAFFLQMLAAGVAAAGPLPPPVMEWRFENLAALNVSNYGNALDIETVREDGETALHVINRRSPKYPWKTPDGRIVKREVDTAWRVTSGRFAVAPGAAFAVKVRAKGTVSMAVASPPPCVVWHGRDGQPLTTRDAEGKNVPLVSAFPFGVSPERWTTTVKAGVVPDDAVSAVLQLSSDQPNILEGQSLTVEDVAYYERRDGSGWDFGDLEAPVPVRVSPSPCADLLSSVSIRVDDASGVDKASLRCALDGTDITARVVWNGSVFSYRPDAPWGKESLHEFTVSCADVKGNAGKSSCFVCFAEPCEGHAAATVRDDGMILLEGRPFFPISIASVRPCPLNGEDVERGVRELKEAGFNLLSSYMVRNAAKRQPDYDRMISACDRLGIKVVLEPALRTGAGREKRMLENILEGRRHPCTLGWSIGDDTAMHRTPDELRRDFLICKAIDPRALTEQADIAHYAGRYGPYAPYTDMFKAELYPIVEDVPKPDELPQIPRDLEFVYGDLAQMKLKNRCVVSIAQSFVGWTRWKRYPTYDEIRAQTFLAIANRSRGISYYTYYSPNGKGAASTRERVAELARVTTEVARLAEALASRDAPCQPKLEVVDGARTDAFGRPPVSCLLKETGLLVAASSAAETAEVRFVMPDGSSFTHVFARNGVLIR